MHTGNIESPLTASRSSITRRDSLSVLAASLGIFAVGGRHAAAATPPAANRDNGARIYSVRDYGAKGDGVTLDTSAVQAAIDACFADGGGTVLVPAGTFQVGTLELKSNVTLHLAAAAKLLGSGRGTAYHAVDAIPLSGDSTLDDGNWALVFAVDAKNVTWKGRARSTVRERSFIRQYAALAAERTRRTEAPLPFALLPLRESHHPQHRPARQRVSQRARDPLQARADARDLHS